MYRLALIAMGQVLTVSACGSAEDDRPATLDFITETILAPTCASAECHSAFKRAVGDQFDTPAATRQTIVANGLATPADADAPESSFLVRTLTVGNLSILDPNSGELVRMPYDAPMPDRDIELITAWIAAGVPGAQCEPNAQNRGCAVDAVAGAPVYRVVECVDGNIGATVTVCPLNQICSFYTGNGQCEPRSQQ